MKHLSKIDLKSSFQGLALATRRWQFWTVLATSFVIFGTLLNLLSSGLAALNLFFATDLAGKCQILGDAFLANFGVGRSAPDFLLNFTITILQSVLLAMIFLVWRKNRDLRQGRLSTTRTGKTSARAGKAHSRATSPSTSARAVDNPTPHQADSARLSTASLAAGLAVLGAGCPTCGTTLITPVLVAVVSTGGYALAGLVSGLLTFAAVLLVLFALYRTSLDYYNLATGRLSCKINLKIPTSEPALAESTPAPELATSPIPIQNISPDE